ncbi:MAG: ABC transporter ATP-binding protein [Treponema sp.]|jgi:ABC-type dipeptide/oligopeptide/nickel transport system ATPase component|nr:ABC transporter ATP-binding protein [Treponema sp.]
MNDSEIILEVSGLKTYFYRGLMPVKAVDDVSFTVSKGRTLGIIGESGCGKSATAFSILRLLDGAARITGGSISFHGENLLEKSERAMEKIRGARIALVFQEPRSALNPVYTIGAQIVEALRLHTALSRKDARARAIELLDLVKMPQPAAHIDSYPHRLSGGMRQRALIALAISCEPELLICDEPTTALDVTTQAQILDLLADLRHKTQITVMLISHDIGVIAEAADDVLVMRNGKVIEYADVFTLFKNPRHPYTAELLAEAHRIDI